MLEFLKKLFAKQRVSTYTFDITNVDTYAYNPSDQLIDWLYTNAPGWYGEWIWLHDPTGSDIPVYRIHFPNNETLIQFRLTWQKGEL